jgi:hypothetical protein
MQQPAHGPKSARWPFIGNNGLELPETAQEGWSILRRCILGRKFGAG